jgi:uncharacterized protein YdcH (DUF465 family)
LATAVKRHFNKELTQERGRLKRFVKEHNQLQKQVEDRQVALNETQHLVPLDQNTDAIIRSLIETQVRERNRIVLLTALINDINDRIQEKERQVQLMEVQEEDSCAPKKKYKKSLL